jgi:hypothetical protein
VIFRFRSAVGRLIGTILRLVAAKNKIKGAGSIAMRIAEKAKE